jgi:hypothetical protein
MVVNMQQAGPTSSSNSLLTEKCKCMQWAWNHALPIHAMRTYACSLCCVYMQACVHISVTVRVIRQTGLITVATTSQLQCSLSTSTCKQWSHGQHDSSHARPEELQAPHSVFFKHQTKKRHIYLCGTEAKNSWPCSS